MAIIYKPIIHILVVLIGAQCVLVSMWTLPNIAMEKFYYHFYTTLNEGALVTDALGAGIRGLRADERYVCRVSIVLPG